MTSFQYRRSRPDWTNRRQRLLGVLAMIAVAMLTGCAATDALNEQSRIDYKSVNTQRPNAGLDVPPDLTSPRLDDRVVIPARAGEAAAGSAAAARPSGAGAAAAGATAIATVPVGNAGSPPVSQSATPSAPQSAPPVQPLATRTNVIEPRLLPSVDGARIERSGNQRWLIVNQAPEKVWSVIREFWQESGFTIQSENPEAGILETDWAENRVRVPQGFLRNALGRVFENSNTSGERDKFRTRLENNAGATEVYISHRGLREVVVGQLRDSTKWEMRPNDPELEIEFLRRLMVKFGPEPQRAAAGAAPAGGAATGSNSTAINASATNPAAAATGGAAAGSSAASAAASDRSRFINNEGVAKVELGEGFDRAWRRVGLALDRGGFTVEDRDRSQGVYFVRYIDPESAARNSSPPGFFSRLFSSDSKATNAQQYRIKVEGTAQASSVLVQSRDGQPVANEVDKQTAVKMLALLNEQLKI